jgi:3-oxoadipate enol-lactonase
LRWQERIAGVLAEGMAPLADASSARWFTPNFRRASPESVAPIRAMLLANDPAGYAGCCAAIRDMDQRPTAHLNTTPTLVVAGAQDPAASMEDGLFLSERAANARLVAFSTAHLSNVEAPNRFADIVVEFFFG